MPLRDHRLHDPRREERTEDAIFRLLDSVVVVGKFLPYEVQAHSNAIELARDRLSAILSKAKC